MFWVRSTGGILHFARTSLTCEKVDAIVIKLDLWPYGGTPSATGPRPCRSFKWINVRCHYFNCSTREEATELSWLWTKWEQLEQDGDRFGVNANLCAAIPTTGWLGSERYAIEVMSVIAVKHILGHRLSNQKDPQNQICPVRIRLGCHCYKSSLGIQN